MEYAYQGENMTPSRCGRMDQACAFGSTPVEMTYDADNVDVCKIRVGKPLFYLIVDLGFAGKSTTKILQGLQQAYPFPQNADQKNVHDLFGEFNLSITSEAVVALRQGDAKKLGQLMNKAQAQFDKYAKPLCPEQLTMPVLYSLLCHPSIQSYIFGGKGVGSQGDGKYSYLQTYPCQAQPTVKTYLMKIYLTQFFAFPLLVLDLVLPARYCTTIVQR